MAHTCPKCESTRVDKRNYATRAGAGIGGLAGGAAGYVGAGTGAAADGAAGTVVDKFVLNNYESLNCGHTFTD